MLRTRAPAPLDTPASPSLVSRRLVACAALAALALTASCEGCQCGKSDKAPVAAAPSASVELAPRPPVVPSSIPTVPPFKYDPALAATTKVKGLAKIKDPAERKAIQQMLDTIHQNGPFLYPRDNVIYRNVEGRLPLQPMGYYREFTIRIPGQPAKSPRRIVAGYGGDLYYTQDKFETFIELQAPTMALPPASAAPGMSPPPAASEAPAAP